MSENGEDKTDRKLKNEVFELKGETLAYFSALITSLAFIPVLADIVFSAIPECQQDPSCGETQKAYLLSGRIYLILFCFISISLIWFLAGRLRTAFFLESNSLISRALPPRDDSWHLIIFIAVSMTAGLTFTVVFLLLVFFPQGFLETYLLFLDRIYMFGIALFLMTVVVIGAAFKLDKFIIPLIAIALLYLVVMLVPG